MLQQQTVKLSCENLQLYCFIIYVIIAAHETIRLLNRSEAHLVHYDYLETCLKVAGFRLEGDQNEVRVGKSNMAENKSVLSVLNAG